MSTTYSVPPSANNGSRGRHGHSRSSHRASNHGQPDISAEDFEELRNNSQLNVNAPVKTHHHRQHSYTPSHISHSGDDLLGEF